MSSEATPQKSFLEAFQLDTLIKPGVFFTLPGGNDGLYTGDLFFNMAVRRFRITGIPMQDQKIRHTMKDGDKGPYLIHFEVLEVLKVTKPEVQIGAGYGVLEFEKARVSGNFMGWLEEFWMNSPAMESAQSNWTVAHGTLAWVG